MPAPGPRRGGPSGATTRPRCRPSTSYTSYACSGEVVAIVTIVHPSSRLEPFSYHGDVGEIVSGAGGLLAPPANPFDGPRVYLTSCTCRSP